MKLNKGLSALILGMVMSFSSSHVFAQNRVYEVTITNLTGGSFLTPILVASHRKGVEILTLGEQASFELERIAEGGDIAPMAAALDADSRVSDVADSGGVLEPGQSVTVDVVSKPGANYISVASMILPSNDGIIALNGVEVPKHSHDPVVFYSPGYDAGTETNDESCDHIPGPASVCGGEPFSEDDLGEGYVHVHSGIHGIGDLPPEAYSWGNPMVKVSVKSVIKE